ncbi:MAG: hypothetical protein WB441_16945, partial [Nocardioidaceae bacterium]
MTFLVTAVILLGEFVFLMTVYHLDDAVQQQRTAQARVAGALTGWQPGSSTAPVEAAVRSLPAGTPGRAALQD